ncbi:hypothetical protein NE237_023009 [Protea cynaroides]|uniref:TF-B3 domain-containing protein n=1 Tax=Protea cynaroides TaxID=273540 RepID=A0A9Q0HE97_9MAGN|nr:hypothetical protein NE237_023009 [Protea cynaroides]
MEETCDGEHLYWTQFQVKRFYQILSPGFHRRLSIPSKFVQCLKDELSGTDSSLCGTVFLKVPSNKTWKIELKRTKDGLFFQNGWSNFIRDHSLEEGNILFFIYRGNLNFDVFMFDHESLCEKPCSYFKCHVSKRGSLDNPVEVTPARHLTPSKRPRGSSRTKSPPLIRSAARRSTKPVSARRKLTIEEVDSSGLDSSSRDSPEPAPRLEKGSLLTYESSRRSVTDEEKQRVREMAEAAFAASPVKSFLVVMRPSHVYRMFHMTIPCDFVEKHFPRKNKEITLRCDGSRWNVTFYYRKSPVNGAFKGCWTDFVFENNIEEHDVCLFELVDDDVREENENDIVFNVRIFRVVEEIVPLTRCIISQLRSGKGSREVEASSSSGRGRGRWRGRGRGRGQGRGRGRGQGRGRGRRLSFFT